MRNFSANVGRHQVIRLSLTPIVMAVALTVTAAICQSVVAQSDIAQSNIGQSAAVEPANTNASTTNDTHLYFFTSLGCAPCEVVKPALAKLDAAGYPVTTVDIRQRPDWASHFRVSRTPTVIMVRNQQIVGRHAGIIGHQELSQWFATSGYVPRSNRTQIAGTNVDSTASPASRRAGSATAVKPIAPAAVQLAAHQSPVGSKSDSTDDGFTSATMHKGTANPTTAGERAALSATVKIKVEDPEGISYATGTVVHSHGSESLVVTCGHVFRDSKGTGEISAQYGFATGKTSVAQGELIFYDADARDIALLVLKTDGDTIPAATIASKKSNVNVGQDTFSIGCDHGQSPTIRHTRIKNRAAYDGSIKYDIYGRPVDGRSGGGLFSEAGDLIGVCNAAVVDVDEGIYSALDTIHWQLTHTHLDHLFDSTDDQSTLALASSAASGTLSGTPDFRSNSGADPARPKVEFPRSTFAADGRTSLVALRGSQDATGPFENDRQQDRAGRTSIASDREVLIIVRNKDDAQPAQTITLANPSHRLIDYLQNMPPVKSEVRQLDVANFREANAVSEQFRQRMQRR